MRSITVTVGPLAAASANNVATLQTLPLGGGTVALNGVLATSAFVGTGAIAGNVLTISAVTSGALSMGNLLNGLGVKAGTIVMGVFAPTTNGVGTYVVNVSQIVSSTTISGNTTVNLDLPRRVIITSTGNDSGVSFLLNGLDWANTPIFETISGANIGVASSVMDYASLTSIVATGATDSTVTVGTSVIAASPWVRFDEYALGATSVQFSVTGTANYTLQTTMDVEPIIALGRASAIWDISGSAAINATTTQTISLPATPKWARVFLNSGSGSVSSTFVQFGVAPY